MKEKIPKMQFDSCQTFFYLFCQTLLLEKFRTDTGGIKKTEMGEKNEDNPNSLIFLLSFCIYHDYLSLYIYIIIININDDKKKKKKKMLIWRKFFCYD